MTAHPPSPREEKPKRRIQRAALLAELQGLVGKALSDYHNDRAEDRAGLVIPALERAQQICVILREKYSPWGRKAPRHRDYFNPRDVAMLGGDPSL